MSHNPPTLAVATATTHRGAIRTHNEDAYTLGHHTSYATQEGAITSAELHAGQLVAIADGMGGHGNGATASHFTLERIQQLAPTLQHEDHVREALSATNHDLYRLMREQPHLQGMGTTLAGLLLLEKHAVLFSVGDSSIFLARPPWLQRLNRDDSISLSGHAFDPTEASSHLITQAIGGRHTHTPINPHIVTRPLRFGDRYLLCSDGLTVALTLDVLEKSMDQPVAAWVQSLLMKALEQDARDNVTVVALEVAATQL